MIRQIKKKLLERLYSEILSGRLASRLLAASSSVAIRDVATVEVVASDSVGDDEKIYLYNNALVFSPYGLAFDAQGKVIAHNLGADHHKTLRRTIREIGVLTFFVIYIKHIYKKIPVSIQAACHLVPRHGYRPNAPNYCHWLLEDLPKLSRYMRLGASIDVLVNSTPSSFQLESLECLDVVGNKFRLNRHFDEVEELYFCKMFSAGSQDGETDKSGRLWVRDHLLAKIEADPVKLCSVYIVRNKDARRGLTNDAEITQSLAIRGFELVNPDHLTFKEQVRLFAQTNVLAAVHGAALANMLFMKTGHVYELSHTHISNRVFFRTLAHELGLTYLCSCSNLTFKTTKQGNDLVTFDADILDIECLIDDTDPRKN